jgi:hypothetical protein
VNTHHDAGGKSDENADGFGHCSGVFNIERYLEQTLDSLKKQSLKEGLKSRLWTTPRGLHPAIIQAFCKQHGNFINQ